MTARLLIGDVFDRMAELPDHSFDMILTSPPFLALRSYLPDDHPDKAKEIGSEATPAEFLDTLLELTAVWCRLLAPHGSLVVELGDTYAGSGGAGGDYDPDGLRAGQPRFRQRNDGGQYGNWPQGGTKHNLDVRPITGGNGWPLDKSLTGIPTLYTWSLAYGRNLLRQPLTARELLREVERIADVMPEISVPDMLGHLHRFLAVAEQRGRGPGVEIEPWRIRNLKPWIRTNPPVGALGDKERSATSYITVATLARDRWFDLDAVRTATAPGQRATWTYNAPDAAEAAQPGNTIRKRGGTLADNPAGAPPLDWVHTVDLILDNELDTRAGKKIGRTPGGPRHKNDTDGMDRDRHPDAGGFTVGARGCHLRRALEAAGILTTLDALDVSPKGYAGAHYAVWPPELCQRLIDEMCPRRVCTQCGEPSRRIVSEPTYVPGPNYTGNGRRKPHHAGDPVNKASMGIDASVVRTTTTLGWSDCGCENCTCDGHDHRGGAGRCAFCDCNLFDHWRPGHVLDPFAGSGTTLAVATGMGRNATGIDLDPRNAHLARERCGMFLEVDEGSGPERPIVDTAPLT